MSGKKGCPCGSSNIGFESLTDRRHNHILHIIKKKSLGFLHPALEEIIKYEPETRELVKAISKTLVGNRRFTVVAANLSISTV